MGISALRRPVARPCLPATAAGPQRRPSRRSPPRLAGERHDVEEGAGGAAGQQEEAPHQALPQQPRRGARARPHPDHEGEARGPPGRTRHGGEAQPGLPGRPRPVPRAGPVATQPDAVWAGPPGGAGGVEKRGELFL